jgi:hypothetical protein
VTTEDLDRIDDGAAADQRDITVRVAAGCMALLVAVAVIRVVIDGWAVLSADHARYVYAGLSLLHGRGYVNEIGDPFLFRAPAFALLTAGGWQLGGFVGAHLVTWALGVTGLLIAVALAARLGGASAAVAATAAILAVPLFWEQIAGLGVDQPQATFFVAAILLLDRLRLWRWLAAGVVLGLGILVKETLAFAVLLLPLAWLPAWTPLTWSRWWRLSLAFGLTVVIAAAWWWVVVWRETGLIFPLNALQAIVPDDLPLEFAVSPAEIIGAAVAVAAWLTVIATRIGDPPVRVLLLGALATLPPAAVTIALSQASRNLTALVLLTAVAVGVAAAELLRRFEPRAARESARPGGPLRRGTVAAMLILAAALVAITGQTRVRVDAGSNPLAIATAERLRPALGPGDHIVSSLRNRSALGVELFDLGTRIALLPVRPVDPRRDLSDYLWLGVRRGTLFGIARDRWAEVVGAEGASYLVFTTPHALSPVELVPALRGRAGREAGIRQFARIRRPGGVTYVFSNDPAQAGTMPDAPLHASPEALLLWLDRARPRQGAVERLLAETPVFPVESTGAGALARHLGGAACFRSDEEGGRGVLVIEAEDRQDDCLDPSDLP